MPESRPLRVFLCHASQDKPKVRELYKRLKSEGWVEPWLDEENLLPGQDFDLEIYRATRDADAIIICLSKVSVAKEGYVQKEVRRALDIAEEKPEGTIYIIPLRFDDCDPSFIRLKQLHWIDHFADNASEKLIKALRVRAEGLKLLVPERKEVAPKPASVVLTSTVSSNDDLDLYPFIKIDLGPKSPVPYPFWVAKYPITNTQYERFLNSPDFANKEYWRGYLKFDERSTNIGRWGDEGLNWLKFAQLDKNISPNGKQVEPHHWNDLRFGIASQDNPVVGVTWYAANAYCLWLLNHWVELPERRANINLKPRLIRLPVELEWEACAGGNKPDGRYPWDLPSKVTSDVNEIVGRANVSENKIGRTTPVYAYSEGASPHGVMDMAGNVWEWQANFYENYDYLALRGGSWDSSLYFAHVSSRPVQGYRPEGRNIDVGFRVVVLPSG